MPSIVIRRQFTGNGGVLQRVTIEVDGVAVVQTDEHDFTVTAHNLNLINLCLTNSIVNLARVLNVNVEMDDNLDKLTAADRDETKAAG